MFSEELRKLIEASLVDGVITDQERAVIRKRALLEGVDPDEVDLVLDAEIQKLKKKQQEAVAKVKKCPACGEIIPAMSVKCPACGYEFRNVEANSSVQKLFSMVNDIYSSNDKDSVKEDKVKMLITNFPVPTAKEDILEFLFLAVPNAKVNHSILAKYNGGLLGGIATFLFMLVIAILIEIIEIAQGGWRNFGIGIAFLIFFGSWISVVAGYICHRTTKEKHDDLVKKNKIASVWKSKCDQVLMKAKYVFSNDSQMLAKINNYESEIM